MQTKTNFQPYSLARAWWVVLIAALFFFYEFIQMNMFNTISQELLQTFQISATKLGLMSSMYFLSNVIFLLVAGVLLDRYSTRWVILTSLGICVLGTALFAMSTSFQTALLCRLLTGIGSAFCFLSVIRLASRWFLPERMALVIGVVVTIAMLGGMVAQTPLSYLVEWLHWRQALLVDAGLGGLFLVLIFLFVHDHPEHHYHTHQEELELIQTMPYSKRARLSFLRLQNWMAGIYTSFMNLSINVLGGLWGGIYLTTVYSISRLEASNIVSMLFLGAIFGCPLAGFISDHLRLRRLPMMWGAWISLILMLTLILQTQFHYWLFMWLFFLLGFFTSTQVISYALVAESSRRVVTAMSVSVVNITTMSGIGLMEPLYGYLMDVHRQHRSGALNVFIASDFHWAMWIFPFCIIIAGIAAYLVKETYAIQQKDV